MAVCRQVEPFGTVPMLLSVEGSVPDAGYSSDSEEGSASSTNIYTIWTDVQLWYKLSNQPNGDTARRPPGFHIVTV